MKSNIKIINEEPDKVINNNVWCEESVEYTGKLYIQKVNDD